MVRDFYLVFIITESSIQSYASYLGWFPSRTESSRSRRLGERSLGEYCEYTQLRCHGIVKRKMSFL